LKASTTLWRCGGSRSSYTQDAYQRRHGREQEPEGGDQRGGNGGQDHERPDHRIGVHGREGDAQNGTRAGESGEGCSGGGGSRHEPAQLCRSPRRVHVHIYVYVPFIERPAHSLDESELGYRARRVHVNVYGHLAAVEAGEQPVEHREIPPDARVGDADVQSRAPPVERVEAFG